MDRVGLLRSTAHAEELAGHADCREPGHPCARRASPRQGGVDAGASRLPDVKVKAAVGGYLEARRLHDACRELGVPLWCGGMLETGIGRAANVALAALPGFTLPGDTSASDRYYRQDLTAPFVLRDGHLEVPRGPGIGVEPIPEILEELTTSAEWVPAWGGQLSADPLQQGEPVDAQGLVGRLEEALEAGLAAAADGAAGGDALGQAAGVHGPAAVTRLGADVGPGHAVDRALGVADGDVVGLDGAAGRARGRPGLAGRGADRDPAHR